MDTKLTVRERANGSDIICFVRPINRRGGGGGRFFRRFYIQIQVALNAVVFLVPTEDWDRKYSVGVSSCLGLVIIEPRSGGPHAPNTQAACRVIPC